MVSMSTTALLKGPVQAVSVEPSWKAEKMEFHSRGANSTPSLEVPLCLLAPPVALGSLRIQLQRDWGSNVS